MSGQDQLRQHIAKYGEHAPEPVLWDAWEALPALLAELDEAGETADYWRKRAVELGTELEELRSAVEVAVNDLTSGLFDGLTGETLKDIAAPLAVLVAPSVPETEETADHG